ncbi:metallophosphoesterase 1-like, partial [Plakobranchus ocellatus]
TVTQNCEKHKHSKYSQPILLQHFPMYRRSDADCHTLDSAPESEKYAVFREKYDCLDQRSTNLLLSLLEPRLVVSGHTHHGCFRTLPGGIPEWTVSSFSWRNRDNPTFLMVCTIHHCLDLFH